MQFMHIKRFVDKMAVVESRQTKDVVLPMIDARGLRDDITKLLSDLYALSADQNKKEEVIDIQVKGGSFK